jgi:hypothetical protein
MAGDKQQIGISSYDSSEARDLVRLFLGEVHSANEHTHGLRSAIVDKDHERFVSHRVELQRSWQRAESTIIALEQLSGHSEGFARQALRETQERARAPLAEGWNWLLAQHRNLIKR